jgi:hypothetical protein
MMEPEFDLIEFKRRYPKSAMFFGLFCLAWFILVAMLFCYALAYALSVIVSAFVGV